MSDHRIRNRNNLIVVACDGSGKFFTVTKRCRSFLQTMGVPQPNGDHFLYPEEGVYLLETCCAMLTIKRNPITLSDAYFILQQKSVPWYKYFTYATLKRTGWIALRPRLNAVSVNSIAPVKDAKGCGVLLNSFPTVEGAVLSMPLLHLATHLIPPHIEFQSTKPSADVLRFSKLTNKSCRPARWPVFPQSVKDSTSWKEYSSKKAEFLSKRNRKKGAPVSNVAADYDYDVYLPNTYTFSCPTEPAFRIISTHVGIPQFDIRSFAQKYSHSSNMVIAIVDQGKVNFVNTSLQPINLLPPSF